MKTPAFTPTATDEEKRVRRNVRLYKQGFTMFRFDNPKGHIVQVHEIDLETGMAYGKGLRGRNRKALIQNIYPMQYK